jgi:GNAT superfamily N-acetyltransferase
MLALEHFKERFSLPPEEQMPVDERFVAESNGHVVGVCGVYRDVTHPPMWCGICWTAVEPNYQRQGIGSELLAHAEKVAAKEHHTLFVWADESDCAIGFYQKHGFKKSSATINPRESETLLVKQLWPNND